MLFLLSFVVLLVSIGADEIPQSDIISTYTILIEKIAVMKHTYEQELNGLRTKMEEQQGEIETLKITQEHFQSDLKECIDVGKRDQKKIESHEKNLVMLKSVFRSMRSNIRSLQAAVYHQKILLKTNSREINVTSSRLEKQEQHRPMNPKEIGTDCGDISGTRSGVYKIKPQGVEEPFAVYCDIQTEGEGWTVFQRRQDGSVNFYRDWASYETGFGDLMGEFWLGNHFIYSITNQGSYELNATMSDFKGNSAYAHYNVFKVGNASSNYLLAVNDYNGNAGDSLAYHNNMKFTTHDRDNDEWRYNCAERYKGGWWYETCYNSNLNGEYHDRGTHTPVLDGLIWGTWKGGSYSLKSTTMSVRRRP